MRIIFALHSVNLSGLGGPMDRSSMIYRADQHCCNDNWRTANHYYGVDDSARFKRTALIIEKLIRDQIKTLIELGRNWKSSLRE